jgi:hypothetical protein
MWFSINVSVDSAGIPTFPTESFDCVAPAAHKIRTELQLDVVHMLCIGGWDAPHPVTTVPPQDYWNAFKHWNSNIMANSTLGFNGFEGIEWDIEGNDDYQPYEILSIDDLNFMGELSSLAKKDGFYASLVPPQSYFDSSTSNFNRSLAMEPTDWQSWFPDFHFPYAGRNSYAYFVSKFGQVDGKDTFDFVSIQLYESYSHGYYNLMRGAYMDEYLENMVA